MSRKRERGSPRSASRGRRVASAASGRARLVEARQQGVDIGLRVAARGRQSRPVEQARLLVLRRLRLDRYQTVELAPEHLENGVNLGLNVLQRPHHLGDALTG